MAKRYSTNQGELSQGYCAVTLQTDISVCVLNRRVRSSILTPEYQNYPFVSQVYLQRISHLMSMFIKTGIKHQYLLIQIKKFQGNVNPPTPGNVHKTVYQNLI